MSLVHTLRLPYPAYLRTIILRSVVMWILVRLSIFGFLLLLGVGFVAASQFPTLGIPALLVWIDRKAWHERLLHANLGTSEVWFWAASLVTSCILDVVAHLLLRGG